MLKRFAQVSMAVFLVLALASMVSAAPNVGNTTQKGSLLVFPKVIEWPGKVTTYIFIGNDNYVETYVKCYWMNENQEIEDFHFLITANQPIVFGTDANTYGPPFDDNMSGTLTCWAQKADDTAPTKFNHLFGYALISSANGEVFYNATAFQYRGTIAQAEALNGVLPLDAASNYDSCSQYLTTVFVPSGGALGEKTAAYPDLTLWPCKQDLRQDRTPTYTKAKFDIWNWDEVKFTGAYKCLKCFWEGYLADIETGTGYFKGYGEEKFISTVLGGSVARLRITGVASSVCGTGTVASPFLGVLLYSEDATFADPIQPFAGYTLFGAGYAVGEIKFDKAETPVEAVQQ